MQFEWDEKKNEINIRQHGIDFADVADIFNYPMLVELDDRKNYGEERWTGIGLLQNRIAVVVYTERYQSTIRIISARKANSHEHRRYQEFISN